MRIMREARIGSLIPHFNGAAHQLAVFIQILVPCFLYQNLEKIGFENICSEVREYGEQEQCGTIKENTSGSWGE